MVSYGGKDLQKRKVLSLEWKSEGVMDDESGESMEPMEQVQIKSANINKQRYCSDVCLFACSSNPFYSIYVETW